MGWVEIITTVPTKEDAEALAEALVRERLAACVQINGPINSTYWWKGNIESAQEWVCRAKTRDELFDDVEQVIRSFHPYEVPEVVCIEIVRASQAYLEWLDAELRR